MALSSTSFKKGRAKTGGRVAGTPNKVDLKESTLRAFDEVGGAEYLKTIAAKYPNAFLNFLGRFVTRDIELSGKEGADPVQFIIRGISDKGNTNTPT